MASKLPIVDQEQPAKVSLRKPNRKLPLARGTRTAEVSDRKIRLHPPGERPWRGREDDHRDKVNVEVHGDTYVVFKPAVGAVSALNKYDYLAFNAFIASDGDREAVARCYAQMGVPEEKARGRADKLAAKLESDGWMRTELPNPEQVPLMSAYLTVTRWCDLGCPYCYQGLNDRNNTDMTFEQARVALERIQAVNPNCQINVTGGEPFSHNRIFDILDLIDEMGFPFIILSNGTYVDEKAASHLKSLKNLKYIQISIDGITEETHALTRGEGHFHKAMAAFQSVVDQGLEFRLAPTVHEANVHELPKIAELAMENGGWISPNQLKELPHAGLNYDHVTLSNQAMDDALKTTNQHLIERFGMAAVLERSRKGSQWDPEVCSVTQPNSRFICGMAHSLVDIDWNGDVYPCHLSKGPELVIGNIFEEDWDTIFQRVEDRGIRVNSHEIEQCSGCKFVSNCAGGCRAGAWFHYGTFESPDEVCELNYSSYLSRLLVGATVTGGGGAADDS